jgi:ATP-dependent DNA helicase RecQ
MSYERISEILREWPHSVLPGEPFADSVCERLRIALKAKKEAPLSLGVMDLCGLIRSVLRQQSMKKNLPARFMISSDSSWPSESDWGRHGCQVLPSNEEGFSLVVANEWSPSWLDNQRNSPFARVESNEQIKEVAWVPSDPAINDAFGRTHYRSVAQGDAVRSVILSEAGSVSIVVLPTGSGKSLVGLSAALIGAKGVSVVIVPTIALGYDQVDQARYECAGKNYHIDAWRSELPDVEKDAIRERIRNGEQRLVYAAPESVTGALASSLAVAATAGHLRAFIVDEAHMVSQWGDGFRPAFQAMAGVWRQLRDASPSQVAFRTVLMTATLTEESHDALTSFFKTDKGCDVIASVYLRPEPSYYLAKCSTQFEQEVRVLETLRHASRPAILYVTRPIDAERWRRRLESELLLRVDCMHGGTTGKDRESAIARWKKNEVDVMVATSAFGLGMDKSDVRLVLHACVPETIDRFYQEVGRGGRDGKASVSILLWTDEDKGVAADLASPSLIGNELGLERWRSIYYDAESNWEDDGTILLANLNAKRPGIVYDGKRNVGWNLKTILLMERVGALEIINKAPPECPQEDGESDDAFNSRRDELYLKHWSTCRVRIVGDHHTLEADFWDQVVSESRAKTLRSANLNWRRMEQLLDSKGKLSSILCQLYSIKSDRVDVDVDTGQSGFPVSPPRSLRCNISQNLSALMETSSNQLLLVTYSTKETSKKKLQTSLLRDLEMLVSHGIREIAMPNQLRGDSFWSRGFGGMHSKAQPERFVCLMDIEEEKDVLWGQWNLPRVTFLDPSMSGSVLSDHLLLQVRPLHIVILPEDMRDPRNTSRFIGDVSPPHSMSLFSFKSNLDL